MTELKLPENMSELHLVRNITSSSRFTTYIVADKIGTSYRATWVDRKGLLTHYKMILRQRHEDDDLSVEDIEKMAEEKVKGVNDELKAIYERTKDLSNELIARTYAMFHDPEKDADIVLSEYMGGSTIYEITHGLSPMQQIPLIFRMFKALDFMHMNRLLNLNLKDNSFWVNLEGRKATLKLMNPGFAIRTGEWNDKIRGTAMYMPPEIAMGEKEKIDEKADLYSAAAIAFHCLTRKYPFEARLGAENNLAKLRKRIELEEHPPSLKSFRSDIPDKLEELIFRLLAKNPDDRGFRFGKEVEDYCLKYWPEECKEIPAEHTVTFTSGEGEADND